MKDKANLCDNCSINEDVLFGVRTDVGSKFFCASCIPGVLEEYYELEKTLGLRIKQLENSNKKKDDAFFNFAAYHTDQINKLTAKKKSKKGSSSPQEEHQCSVCLTPVLIARMHKEKIYCFDCAVEKISSLEDELEARSLSEAIEDEQDTEVN